MKELGKAEELILNYYADVDLDNESDNVLEALREMYKDRIINFESIRNSDESFLKSLLIDVMLKRGELTLSDTQKLKKTFDIDELKLIVLEAMESKDINEDQKFILIMNMFFENNEEDLEARIEFLKMLKFESFTSVLNQGLKDIYGPIQDDKDDKDDVLGGGKPTHPINGNKFVYPDNVKWLFFMIIDKDATVTKYANGFVEFYLPKFEKRIIEKYYEVDLRTKEVKDFAYGLATCTISDESYRKYRDLFVEITSTGEENLNDKNLRKLVPLEDRVRHETQNLDRNWMRCLAEKLGIQEKWQEKSRYTENENKELWDFIEENKNNFVRLER